MTHKPATTTSRVGPLQDRGRTLESVSNAILQSLPTALFVCAVDGRMVAFNDQVSALLGYAPGDVMGQDVGLILAEPQAGLAAVIGGDPETCQGGRRCLAIRHHDGTSLVLKATISVSSASEGQRLFTVLLDPAGPSNQSEDRQPVDRKPLEALAQNLPGIIFQRSCRTDGQVTYPFFSSGVRDILGYTPDEMRVTQDGCLDCIHWADRADYMEHMRTSLSDLSSYTEEWRAITRDGQVRWLSGTFKLEQLPSGEVSWDAVMVDITDRMRAEHRLEMIMDHAADGVLTIDEEGRVETANMAIAQTFGWTIEDLVGQDVTVLTVSDVGDRGGVNYVRSYLLTGESAMLGRGPVELIGQHKDGHTFPIELSLSEVLTEGQRLFIAIVRDITKRKKTELRLHETEQRLRTITDNIQGLVYQRVMYPDGRFSITYMSEGFRSILGIDLADGPTDGDVFLHLMAPEDRQEFVEAMQRSAATLTPMEADVRLVSPGRESRWLRSWSSPRLSEAGTIIWDGVALDVTDRKRAEEKLTFLAYHDPVTTLGNRAMFWDRFASAKEQADQDGHALAILSLGLDRFTIINATLGHSRGDQVLLAAAERIQKTLRAGDVVCRAGGDRFLLMLMGITSEDDVNHQLATLLNCFETPLRVAGLDLSLTVSAGAALYPANGVDAETLIMHSEAALHLAKTEGPASSHLFTQEMGDRAQKILTLQHRLRRALHNREFVAYFQPQVETRSGRIVGMEALVRWVSPEDGLVPPGQFIDVAEEIGLIDAMCEQVLRDACRWNKRWQDAGLAHIPVAVNISGRQFHNTRLLLQTVDSVLAEFDLDPRFLELELTESSAMSDPDNAIRVVQSLAERGVACAIDDFGTGYSSLSVLKRFPIRKLKIDRSFVSEVTTDSGDAAIVCAMIAMANALNLKVVAEGVETQDHLNFLHGVGCDQIQGFLMSRPLPGAEMERLFRESPSMPLPA